MTGNSAKKTVILLSFVSCHCNITCTCVTIKADFLKIFICCLVAFGGAMFEPNFTEIVECSMFEYCGHEL